MGLIRVPQELYSPELQDDLELKSNGGPYLRKFAFLQVTIRLPEKRVINWIAMIYGFLPFLLGLSFLVGYVVTQRFVFLYVNIVGLSLLAVNELALKPLLRDPRPPETANRQADGRVKYGMPSGHVLVTGTVMSWVSLEVFFRSTDGSGMNYPWLLAALLTCGPVPWARVHNKDHTLAQVIVAFVMAMVLGVIAFRIRTENFPDHWYPWDLPAKSSAVGQEAEAVTENVI
ncbi:unnamed protein product [Amoebophrya sp. A25]|nr:unnamed protein product [Amoebophrya sp. A25]|eukprot:GSA25T00007447001.1